MNKKKTFIFIVGLASLGTNSLFFPMSHKIKNFSLRKLVPCENTNPTNENETDKDLEELKTIIKSKKNLNSLMSNKKTPILFACEKNEPKIVKFLLQNGVKETVNLACNGLTPLIQACFNSNAEIVELLLKYGAINSINIRAILYAFINNNTKIAAMLLLRCTPKILNQTNPDTGQTPLATACTKENLDIVNMLLWSGANVETESSDGTTPLIVACIKQNIEIIEALISKGADINRASSNGMTPLSAACLRGNITIAEFFILKGARIDDESIRIAKKHKDFDMLKYLLQKRFDQTKKDKF